MKYVKFYSITILIFIISCAKNINDSRCNYLLNLDIYYEVNLNLPQYSSLNFISNSVFIPNVGNGGLIRWDLTKGFTQNCNGNDFDCTNGYQQDRVDVLKNYADYSWSLDPDHYVIFEHLGGSTECIKCMSINSTHCFITKSDVSACFPSNIHCR